MPSENIINETKTVFIVSIYSKEIGFTQQHPRFECSHPVVDQPRWSWDLKGVHSFIIESIGLPLYLRLAECLVSQVFSHPESQAKDLAERIIARNGAEFTFLHHLSAPGIPLLI